MLAFSFLKRHILKTKDFISAKANDFMCQMFHFLGICQPLLLNTDLNSNMKILLWLLEITYVFVLRETKQPRDIGSLVSNVIGIDLDYSVLNQRRSYEIGFQFCFLLVQIGNSSMSCFELSSYDQGGYDLYIISSAKFYISGVNG